MQHFRIVLLFILFFSGACFSQSVLNYPIEVNRLSESVVVLKIYYFDDWDLTCTAVSTEKGIVIIDSGLSVSMGNAFRSKVEELFPDQPISYVTATHAHFDHTGGFPAFSDITLIGHESFSDYMQNYDFVSALSFDVNSIAQLEKDLVSAENDKIRRKIETQISMRKKNISDRKSNPLKVPDIYFTDALSIDMGDKTINMYYFGNAHHESDVLISIPEEGIVFTGDILNNFGGDPAFRIWSEDYYVNWVNVLEKIDSTNNNIKKIVQGHIGIHGREKLDGLLSKIKYANSRFSALKEYKKAYELGGIAELKKEHLKIELEEKDHYFYDDTGFIIWGYELMGDNKILEAIEVLNINISVNTESWNGFDSLAEAYLKSGDISNAVRYYQKSLELNPDNENAKDVLNKINGS